MRNYNIKKILGSKMYLIKDDVGLSSQLMEHGVREEASTKYVQSIMKPDWIVIDIGANLGYYALLEAKLAKFVYAIEPIKRSCETLNKSIELNGYKNIRVYNLAISDKNGEAEIKTSERLNWATMVDGNKVTENYRGRFKKFEKGTQEVKTLTLDSFVEQENITRIDFMRMDVEGFEIEIMKNISKTVELMPKGSFLLIEFHPVIFENREMLINTFEKIIVYYGFKIAKIAWKKEEFNLSNIEFKNWLLKKNACPQVFFRKS